MHCMVPFCFIVSVFIKDKEAKRLSRQRIHIYVEVKLTCCDARLGKKLA